MQTESAQADERAAILEVMDKAFAAVKSGEYEFWIDSEFSHCGVDLIDMVKVDGEWKIANFSWTVEKEGCPTAPGSDA